MRLDNKNIYIRPWDSKYRSDILAWYYSGDYPFFFRNMSHVMSEEHFRDANIIFGGSVFNIFSRETNAMIGIVGIVDYRPVPRTGKYMALVTKENQEKGYMYEALELLHEYGFKNLDLRQTMIDVAEKDERSNELCEKAGYDSMGVVDLCVVNGEVQNEYRYSMSRKAYIKRYGGG